MFAPALKVVKVSILISIINIALDFNSLSTGKEDKSIQANEKRALAKFRVLAADVLKYDYEHDDDFLIRWLRECNLDVRAADQMLRRAMKWRKDNKYDSILNETVMEIRPPPYPSACNTDTLDIEGKSVLICEMEGVDYRKLINAGHREKVMRYYFYWLEKNQFERREACKRTGKVLKYPTLISNAQGFNVKQHGCYSCLELTREMMILGNLYNPRSHEHIIFINVPTIALPIIELLKPVFSEYSRNAFRSFGSDRREWSQFLLTLIPSHQLPIEYGGTRQTKHQTI